MSISPRKNIHKPNIPQLINPQYLNFIRKNHLKFQLESILSIQNTQPNQIHHNHNNTNHNSINYHNSNNNNNNYKQPISNTHVFDDQRQFYQLNNHKQIQSQYYQSIHQNLVDKYIAQQKQQNSSQTNKNYKTIDIVTQSYQKYLQIGDSLIVGNRKINPQSVHKLNTQLQYDKSKQINKHKQYIQGKQLFKDKQLLKNKQVNNGSLLQNQQFIKLLKNKNKQIASKLRSAQTKQIHNQKIKYRSQTPNCDIDKQTISGSPIKQSISGSAVLGHPASQFKIHQKSGKQSNLLIKKQNMRDLWKEKFVNWNNKQIDRRSEKKKPQSQLRFPSINANNKGDQNYKNRNKRKAQSHNEETHYRLDNYEQILQLDDCNLIRNSKPKLFTNQNISKYNNQDGTSNQVNEKQLLSHNNSITQNNSINQNSSIQMISTQSIQLQRMNLKRLQQIKRNKIQQWQSSLVNRQHSISNYHKPVPSHSQHGSLLHSNNHSVSVIKRRRNVPQKVTHFLLSTGSSNYIQSNNQNNNNYHNNNNQHNNKQHNNDLQSSTQSKKKNKNYKQLMKQKQKQFQTYLMQNAILKSAKIVNYYQKQQVKNKYLFNQLQKNYCGLQDKLNSKLSNMEKYNHQQRLINQLIKAQKQISQKMQSKQLLNKKLQSNQITKNTQQLNKQLSNSQNQQLLQSSQVSNLIQRSPQRKKGPNINSIKKQYDLSIYQIKIRSYRQFIFMINLTHKVFINIPLKSASQAKSQPKFTYFIGKGNNRLLIKSLMNRRFWWEQTKQINKANFVWTQLKVNQLYNYQKVSNYAHSQNKFDKIQEPQINPKKQIKKKISQKTTQKAGSYKSPLPQIPQQKVLTKLDIQIYDNIMANIAQNPDNALNFSNRSKFMPSQSFNNFFTQQTLRQQKVHNHLEFNYFIGNKKALFYNLQNYYKLIGKNVFEIIPYTLHIKKGVQDPAYNTFLKQ